MFEKPLRINQLPVFFFIFFVWAGPLIGQALQKRKLTISDYNLWSQLYTPQISPDGDWISFQLHYKGKSDSLVLINTRNRKEFFFTMGERVGFADSGRHFIFITPEGVGIMDLATEALQWVEGANQYRLSKKGNHIITSRPTEEGQAVLQIKDLMTSNSLLILNVKEFALCDSGKSLAYIAKEEGGDIVGILNLQTYEKRIIAVSQQGRYRAIQWDKEGQDLLFTESESLADINNRLLVYKGDIQTIKKLPLQKLIAYEPGMQFIEDCFFSDDGKMVFFYVGLQEDLSQEESDSGAEVEIWKGDDKRSLSSRRYYGGGRRGPWLMAWWPDTGKTFQIGSKDLPKAILTNDQKRAVVFSEDDYEPDTRQNPQADLFIVDLENGSRQLIGRKLVPSYNTISLSPGGQYISYFKDGEWWNYDVLKHKIYNLTSEINQTFYNIEYDKAGDLPPFGNPGWTSGDKEIILYDQYDIWLLNFDGANPRRLTKGRESFTNYRLQHSISKSQMRSPELYGAEYSTENGLVISATERDYSISYYILNQSGKMKVLANHNNKLHSLRSSEDGKTYSYVEESFNLPPRIWIKREGEKNKLIYQTNQHFKNFKTGPVERISYKSKDGKPLEGILYYPDDYEPGKKYPMIVKIYERQSPYFYNYINPSQNNQDGFNPRIYTSEEYAVLYPDISYILKNPGISATECVSAAVSASLKTGIVDENRVGLIGHSFGGYETAFIITQTDIFSAAVAGAPATDLTSFYFNIGWNSGKPDMWRFEDQQWRFGTSYFENPEAYIRNSPLHQAEGINTPVLLWSGRKDLQVAHNQTLEFYLALKRLKKETTLLIYPQEAHSLIDDVNQKDLTQRIKNWFDYHLKVIPSLN